MARGWNWCRCPIISPGPRTTAAGRWGASRPKPPPAGPPTSVDRIRIQRLSVQAEPLGPVLRQLADRLGLELRIDEKALQAAGVSLDQRVTVKVENVTIDELFRRLLHSTGLKCRRHQKILEIVPDQ